MSAFWIPVIAAGVLYGALSILMPEKLRRRAISKRPSLSFDEIYRTHLQQLRFPKESVESAWTELARDLELDAAKLRPSDRFAVELSVKGFPLVDLNEAVTSRLRERLRGAEADAGADRNAASIKTVQDYVEFICSLAAKTQRA